MGEKKLRVERQVEWLNRERVNGLEVDGLKGLKGWKVKGSGPLGSFRTGIPSGGESGLYLVGASGVIRTGLFLPSNSSMRTGW
jgi:hypothetical protein